MLRVLPRIKSPVQQMTLLQVAKRCCCKTMSGKTRIIAIQMLRNKLHVLVARFTVALPKNLKLFYLIPGAVFVSETTVFPSLVETQRPEDGDGC